MFCHQSIHSACKAKCHDCLRRHVEMSDIAHLHMNIVNTRDNEKHSPMFYAIEQRDTYAVKFLQGHDCSYLFEKNHANLNVYARNNDFSAMVFLAPYIIACSQCNNWSPLNLSDVSSEMLR